MISFAQRVDKPGEPYEYYASVYVHASTKGWTAKISFFEETKSFYIVEKSGEKKWFENLSDIVNYMTRRGWVFANSGIRGDYLDFKKVVKSDEEAKQYIDLKKE